MKQLFTVLFTFPVENGEPPPFASHPALAAALQHGPDGDGSILSGAKALESCAYLAQSMLAHNFRDPSRPDPGFNQFCGPDGLATPLPNSRFIPPSEAGPPTTTLPPSHGSHYGPAHLPHPLEGGYNPQGTMMTQQNQNSSAENNGYYNGCHAHPSQHSHYSQWSQHQQYSQHGHNHHGYGMYPDHQSHHANHVSGHNHLGQQNNNKSQQSTLI